MPRGFLDRFVHLPGELRNNIYEHFLLLPCRKDLVHPDPEGSSAPAHFIAAFSELAQECAGYLAGSHDRTGDCSAECELFIEIDFSLLFEDNMYPMTGRHELKKVLTPSDRAPRTEQLAAAFRYIHKLEVDRTKILRTRTWAFEREGAYACDFTLWRHAGPVYLDPTFTISSHDRDFRVANASPGDLSCNGRRQNMQDFLSNLRAFLYANYNLLFAGAIIRHEVPNLPSAGELNHMARMLGPYAHEAKYFACAHGWSAKELEVLVTTMCLLVHNYGCIRLRERPSGADRD